MSRLLKTKRAHEIIERFPGSRVLVIGDLMVDQFIWGKVSRISPEAPVPVVEVVSESLMLGGCANVLNNIHSMGGRASVAGVIGSDAMGDWLVRELAEKGVDADGVIIEKGRPTTVKTRIVAGHQQVVRFDREKRMAVAKESVSGVLGYLRRVKKDLGAVVLSDYGKGMVSRDLLKGIREEIAGSGILLFVDPKSNDFTLYEGSDVITPNHHEAIRALGLEESADIVSAGMELLRKFQIGSVLITRGEEGMTLFERNGEPVHIPAMAKEVFDVTGAGDTVIGVLALAAASGASLREAAVLANHAAGIVVGKVGTATASREELRGVL
jgi:D-beta-D-heptose 7-phosphate kinase/D-beta-D-heptose 1-phosphate adenosyltransferase